MKTKVGMYYLLPEGAEHIFCEGVTEIAVDDEGAGPFLVIRQHTDSGTQEIKMDFDEVKMLIAISENLKVEWDERISKS